MSKINPSAGGPTEEPASALPDAQSESLPSEAEDNDAKTGDEPETVVEEVGGRTGPDPTRFGDWEINGRCIDF